MSTACSSAFFSLTQAEYAAGEIKSKVSMPQARKHSPG